MRKLVSVVILLLLSFSLPVAAQKSDAQKVVDHYAKELKSRDTAKRAEAVESLGNLKVVEAVDLLIAALSDKDASVRRAAAGGLWDSSEVALKAIPALRNALTDPETAVVMRAAGALISMDVEPKEIAAPLRLVLDKGDSVDRFLAARALIGIESGEKLTEPILNYIRANTPPREKDADYRTVSARKENYEAGAEALMSLARTQERKIIPDLVTRLEETPRTAQPVMRALGELRPRPDKWIEILIGQLEATDADTRETAVELLALQKAKAADVKLWVPAVASLTTDEEKGVRNDAIMALKGAGGLAHEGLGAVLELVKSEKDDNLREWAAEAVGYIADASAAISAETKKAMAQKALPILSAAIFSDSDSDVREAAVRSLDRLHLDDSVALPLLARAAVEGKDIDSRDAALGMLRNRGKESLPVIETIRPLLKDPNERIRSAAESAVSAMQSSHSGRQIVAASPPAANSEARETALEWLREKELSFTENDFYGALHRAELETITAFLDGGMSAKLKFSSSAQTPVLWVFLKGDACDPGQRPTPAATKSILKTLLARGADAKAADEYGNTPLMGAIEKCDAEVIKMLLKAGADMNAKNSSGMTAFEFGLWFATDGAAALVEAGYRLPAAKVTMYNEAHKDKPKVLALVKKATKK